MSSFGDQQVSAFLDALASAEPTPGGGTAAAIAGAMGASLLMMVAGLTKSRTGSEEERVALAEARASLTSVRERLIALADEDTEAFNQVMAAYRLPKATDGEKAARTDAIQQALKAATTTPLDTLRAASDGLRLGAIVKERGNPSAASDADVGLGLLRAAAEGAAANVNINLESIQDEAFKKAAIDSVEQCRAAFT
jgi:formiminotetrahydrofolate cyclodeaminase